MIKAVIFDLDDTLYDYNSINPIGISNVRELAKEKLGITHEAFEEALKWARKETKAGLGNVAAGHNRLLYFQKTLEYLGENPTSIALEMYEAYWGTLLREMSLNNGAMELLNYLKNKGIKIGICTDLTVHIQHRKLRKLGIDAYIDALVTGEEVGVVKPDKKMFDLTMKKLGVESKECIHVGDSYAKDIVGAENAGIKAFWFNPYGNIKEDSMNKGTEIRALSELKTFVMNSERDAG